MIKPGKKKKRTGVLVGVYVSPEVKARLIRRAAANHMTLSEYLRKIFKETVGE